MKKYFFKLIYRIDNIKTRLFLLSLLNRGKKNYECPLCGYHGFFIDAYPTMGMRKDVLCPVCLSFERHRLQYLAFMKVISEETVLKNKRVLHFAPEPCIHSFFYKKTQWYCTADRYKKTIDCTLDIQSLPFVTDSFDIIWASHILEHVKEDTTAIQELSRVLTKGGIALLPVPILGKVTLEYDHPRKSEYDHVRSPGFDYFDKFNDYFEHTRVFTSDDFSEKYGLSIISQDANKQWIREQDYVPICIR